VRRPAFSLVVNHTPWVPERVAALEAMRNLLGLKGNAVADARSWGLVATKTNARDFRGTDWQVSKVLWALDQWRWAAGVKPAGLPAPTHHVFMTDDLHIIEPQNDGSGHFWQVLNAMVEAVPDGILGLLSNHPAAPRLALEGQRWYRTNSWLVGPCYVLPHKHLMRFLEYFEALPPGNKQDGQIGYRNDDSSLNEWITGRGGPGETYHPLPTIIEHRNDIGSTVGHGDEFSLERVSWRTIRTATKDETGTIHWSASAWNAPTPREMTSADFWAGASTAPLLNVGG